MCPPVSASNGHDNVMGRSFNSDGPTGTVTRIGMAVWPRPTAIPIDLRHTGTISMRCSIPARSPELRV